MKGDAPSRLDLIIRIVSLCVAMFGIFQYFHNITLDRSRRAAEASLGYVASYNGEDLKQQRRLLFEFWIRNGDALIWLEQHKVSGQEYQSFMLSAFENDKKGRGLLESVYNIANFYDQVEVCRSTHICDSQVILNHFCPSATDFRDKYGPIFVQLGALSGTPNFAQGVKEMAQACSRS